WAGDRPLPVEQPHAGASSSTHGTGGRRVAPAWRGAAPAVRDLRPGGDGARPRPPPDGAAPPSRRRRHPSPTLPARRDRPGDTLTMEREHPAARARRPRRTAMSTPDQPDRPDDRQPPPPAHETGE